MACMSGTGELVQILHAVSPGQLFRLLIMNLIPIGEVAAQIHCGAPLPWNVRDVEGKLLLARGYLVETTAMQHNLLRRGVFVDADEVQAGQESSPMLFGSTPRPVLPFAAQWDAVERRLTALLANHRDAQFVSGISDVESMITVASEEHADQTIYSVIRHDQERFASYGITHSIHVACVCSILAKRLGWSKKDRETVINAALTMNLSIIGLQGDLARSEEGADQATAAADPRTPGGERAHAAGCRCDR